MTTIKSYAVQNAEGNFEPFSYEVGALDAHDVEIDVQFCGICHSDLSMKNNEWGITEYPFVPGHEVIGQINEVGAHVTHLKKGDWVGLGWHSAYCETCPSCMGGDHNLCATAEGTIVGRHGGFADKVRANAKSTVLLPEGIDKQMAGPLLCGGITVFNPLVQFDIKPTDKVAVIGIGGLGHLALQFYRAWGCDVTAFTSSEDKKQEALKLGASQTINSRDPEEISAAAGQFDYIISTANANLDWNAYISTLKPKGRLHFVGVATKPLDIELFPMIMGQRSVSASPVGSPATISKMLDFAKLHNIKTQIETYPMDQVNEAMKRLESGKARYRIVLER